mmetsp:Transcript_74140/g.204625  ORF Transcript_74140/g.204625 Transcript_74140/m.204625 type:complete len:228 (-) Transcript_74140:788-1471(-)
MYVGGRRATSCTLFPGRVPGFNVKMKQTSKYVYMFSASSLSSPSVSNWSRKDACQKWWSSSTSAFHSLPLPVSEVRCPKSSRRASKSSLLLSAPDASWRASNNLRCGRAASKRHPAAPIVLVKWRPLILSKACGMFSCEGISVSASRPNGNGIWRATPTSVRPAMSRPTTTIGSTFHVIFASSSQSRESMLPSVFMAPIRNSGMLCSVADTGGPSTYFRTIGRENRW